MAEVTVVYSAGPRHVEERQLTLAPGTTATAALQMLRNEETGRFSWPDPAQLEIGVWGKKVEPSQVLKDGDRLEIYRPLKADPKVARRERFSRQGTRAAGLFATRRPGAKPDY